MNRSMWIMAAILGAMALAAIYQDEIGGGIERPWAECKESMVQQMLSGNCTPRRGAGFATPRQ
jgi:hypothetical protein